MFIKAFCTWNSRGRERHKRCCKLPLKWTGLCTGCCCLRILKEKSGTRVKKKKVISVLDLKEHRGGLVKCYWLIEDDTLSYQLRNRSNCEWQGRATPLLSPLVLLMRTAHPTTTTLPPPAPCFHSPLSITSRSWIPRIACHSDIHRCRNPRGPKRLQSSGLSVSVLSITDTHTEEAADASWKTKAKGL